VVPRRPRHEPDRWRLDALRVALHRHRVRLRRSALARRLERRRLTAFVAAIAVASVVALRGNAAERSREAWGTTRPVLVATATLAPGATLDTSTTAIDHLPARLVPAGALTTLPAGRRVRTEVGTGEMLTTARLAPRGLGATAAALPAGTAAVTVVLDEAAAPLRAGDVVDAYRGARTDPYAPEGTTSGDAAEVVAAGAVVISVDARGATLAVARSQVAATVAANAAGGVQLVVVG
jgi:Flp pilus assembly protein CpaB